MPAFPKNRVVRLKGADLANLRAACWVRDRRTCQICGHFTFENARFDGDPLAYDMSHKRVRRLGGDTLENVETLCHKCHMQRHAGRIK